MKFDNDPIARPALQYDVVVGSSNGSVNKRGRLVAQSSQYVRRGHEIVLLYQQIKVVQWA